MAIKDEGRLTRWSRLKQESREEAPSPPAEAEPEAAPPISPPISPEDLPSIDSLNADSDFTVFLREGVPEDLARAALRKLWLSDPVFGELDGLNDYDEDFNLIDKLIQIGDGDAEQPEAADAESTAQAPESAETPDGAEAPDVAADSTEDSTEELAVDSAADLAEEEDSDTESPAPDQA